MKIRFLTNTNIRESHLDFSKTPIGIIHIGKEIEVEDRLYKGISVEGIDTYFKDKNGWFYWSGRAAILYQALPEPQKSRVVEGETGSMPVAGSWAMEVRQEPDATKPDVSSQLSSDEKTLAPKGTNFDVKKVNWGLSELKVPEVFWKQRGLSGQGINIVILDTGLNSDQPGLRVKGFRNFCGTNGDDIADEDGQGTFCAHLIGGGADSPILGAAPAATLYIGKVMRNFRGIDFDRFVEAFKWALAQPADLIFTSVEIKENSLNRDQKIILHSLFDQAVSKGIACIASAGQSKSIRPENRYPAALATCLSVGSFAKGAERSKQDIRSYTLDVLAPGESLIHPEVEAPYSEHTSGFAAALTTGALALILESERKGGKKSGVADLIRRIRETAVPKYPSTKCRDIEYGCGFFNPVALMEQLDAST